MRKNICSKKKPFNRFDWRTVLLKNSGGISSKRVCGILGWLCCLGLLITSYILGNNVPQFGELIAITSASLLGLDSVTSIWNKSVNLNL